MKTLKYCTTCSFVSYTSQESCVKCNGHLEDVPSDILTDQKNALIAIKDNLMYLSPDQLLEKLNKLLEIE